MNNNTRYRVVIPAAGRGVRSKLAFPKCLQQVDGIPILVRLCQKLKTFDETPVIIINPLDKALFEEVTSKYDITPEWAFQNEARGMGDAILCADDILSAFENIILVWSDIPYLHHDTISNLIICHQAHDNYFSLITSVGSNCYTFVERHNGKLLRIIESRASNVPPAPYGERDIGLFVFRKEAVFRLLKEDSGQEFINGKNEHGFLYIIDKLVRQGYKVEGYPIAKKQDILSFNTPEDLAEIDRVHFIE